MLSIVWFRRDLRLRDNPALAAAAAQGPVLPVYIHAPAEEGPGAPGGASRWWLHHSLAALQAELEAHGLKLVIRRGSAASAIQALAKESGASAVYWNRRYEPVAIGRDAGLVDAFEAAGLGVHLFNGALLREPWEMATQQGRPYQVFTPFYRALLAKGPAREGVLGLPRGLQGPTRWPAGERLAVLGLLPQRPWDAEFSQYSTPGEAGARVALKAWLQSGLSGYVEGRDRPDQQGTSRLSPHLHFGELSPLQVWEATRAAAEAQPAARQGAEAFLRELVWREFSHHLINHFPATVDQPLRLKFKAFPWAKGIAAPLKAWQRGLTGYPIVDAGMRELWRTGFMHNRVRMIAASFLVKDLLIDWRRGAAWFMDTLVDADLAQNTLGWQWTAGCGADAAPYFRVFNPVLQGQKFDPAGAYVRRWVPELAKLPDRWIHQPWAPPAEVLAAAGVQLGSSYPKPLVEHAQARERALEAFRALPKR